MKSKKKIARIRGSVRVDGVSLADLHQFYKKKGYKSKMDREFSSIYLTLNDEDSLLGLRKLEIFQEGEFFNFTINIDITKLQSYALFIGMHMFTINILVLVVFDEYAELWLVLLFGILIVFITFYYQSIFNRIFSLLMKLNLLWNIRKLKRSK
ncbi:MAG: hypothetical protein OXB84_03070 [Halobacteriovoraceae bacterium]|nr:hypothetical protein [Halobacteriovoraceae bacterium]